MSTAFKQQKGSVEKLQSRLKVTEEEKARLSSGIESHSHQLNVNFRFLKLKSKCIMLLLCISNLMTVR